MRFVRPSAFVVALLMVMPVLASAQGQADASHPVQGGGIFVPGWQGKLDPGAQESVNDAKHAGGRRPARDHRSGHQLLESGERCERRLHGVGHLYRAKIHEPEHTSASLRNRDRRQRHGHGAADGALLRGLWERQLHRARVWSGGLSDERPQGGECRDP